jgi:type III restriction enzyme
VLLQADARNGEVPVEVLKSHLTDTIGIEPRRIAVATGTQRELEQVNLFDPACPIDFVITVEALKEGWDCSFAYVFATVQNIRSARDMEQLLGRVLRQPYATPLSSLHLNRAYAHVAAPATLDVANRLSDRLIAMGFEEYEAAAAVEPAGPDLFGFTSEGLEERSEAAIETSFPMAEAAAKALAAAAPGAVTISHEAGTCVVKLTGVLSNESIAAALAAAPVGDRDVLERDLQHHQARALKAASPMKRGAKVPAVPQLAIPVQGELVLFDSSVLAEIADFSLTGQPADLPGFTARPDASAYLIDVERARLRVETKYLSEQLDINLSREDVRREDVIRALDRKLQRADLLQADIIAWIGRALDELAARGIELTYVARHLNEVADAMEARINALADQAKRGAFQATLFGGGPKPRIAPGFEFKFPADNYPARFYYAGRYVFHKHFYGPPGELDSDTRQEETACAIAIDQMPEVEFWVRNLERRGAASFALPTSTHAFYPDFVAFLTDGRVLVVEYKGAVYFTNEDSREKRDIGGAWAAASEGRCRFVMVTAPSSANGRSVEQQLRDAIA